MSESAIRESEEPGRREGGGREEAREEARETEMKGHIGSKERERGKEGRDSMSEREKEIDIYVDRLRESQIHRDRAIDV